jgi:hypothetical protein
LRANDGFVRELPLTSRRRWEIRIVLLLRAAVLLLRGGSAEGN